MTCNHRPLLLVLLTLSAVGMNTVYADKTDADADETTEEKGKVYRKYHPDGVVEFSDKPLRGGDELKVEQVPTYRFGAPAKKSTEAAPTDSQSARPTDRPPKLRTKKLQPKPYSKLVITRPTRDESIRANDGNINVGFTLEPALQQFKGHKLVYLLDGKPAPTNLQGQTLKNVDRGTHSLVLQVVDKHNQVLIHSDSVTFHVKRYFKPRSQAPSPVPTEPDVDPEFET